MSQETRMAEADPEVITGLIWGQERRVFAGTRQTPRIKEITPDRSLKYRNHSPDGFAWGYGGSGPAQLALAILLEFDEAHAEQLYQDFKWEVIANLPQDKDFVLPMARVREWLKARGV
jgi:hypothetical protein